ncbi:MAG TPA: sigma-70 family RNA polymerase sigma factor [Myxococcota bacterium]|nr:sigma-70 family RNA polymerase sigma factor [Myxococcota bacterium]
MSAAEVRRSDSTTEPATDERLVERVLGGDKTAFESLYSRYFNRIFHYLEKRLRNRADTEETVQEVFFNVFSSIDSYRGEAPFVAWVFGLTRRTLARRFKKKRHATVPLGEDELEGVDLLLSSIRREPDPLEAYEATERLARMTAAVTQELSSEQWNLFRLHHLQNKPIQEIARDLDKSVDAVKSNLYRARKLLLAR